MRQLAGGFGVGRTVATTRVSRPTCCIADATLGAIAMGLRLSAFRVPVVPLLDPGH